MLLKGVFYDTGSNTLYLQAIAVPYSIVCNFGNFSSLSGIKAFKTAVLAPLLSLE